MSDIPISKMNDKQLRNAVQLLYDELAMFKRKYNDVVYNLDSDNFGKSFSLEQNNMKAQIKITAEGLKSTVSKVDLGAELEKYSTVEQTVEAITANVTAEYVNSLIGDTYVTNALLSSEMKQTAEGIYSTVSAEYETKADAEYEYSSLRSSISQTAGEITSKVENLENFNTSVFTQTEYGFTLDGEQTTFTGVIYLTDNDGNKRFSIFHDESQYGMEQVIMHSNTASEIPIVLGTKGSVFLELAASGYEVATRAWVENEAQIVAVFG